MLNQEEGCCHECKKPFKDDDDLKYKGMFIYHKQCHRKAINRANGRSFECPKCGGSGVQPTNEDITQNYRLLVTNASCDVCNGNGYTVKKMVAIMKITGYVEE